jgi:hypothetical protein
MQSKASTVAEYLASLPDNRRAAIEAVRAVILKNLDKPYEEGMQYGMIGYYLPHSVYPPGYHCDPRQPLPFAGLASQKNSMSLYLMCVYAVPEHNEWFRDAWLKAGKRLDMGKGCVRFKTIDDVPLDVVAKAVRLVSAKQLIEFYESIRPGGPKAGVGAKPGAGSSANSSAKAGAKRPAASKKPASSGATSKARASKKKPSARAGAAKPVAKAKKKRAIAAARKPR